jgi:hypothetical protein
VSAEARGATPENWFHFDLVLGLGAHLLPCVQADAQPTPGSSIKKFGKVPSLYDGRGQAFGLSGWQKRPILGSEVQAWSADSRLNLCLRTGPISGVYAVDVDIEDAITATAVHALIDDAMPDHSLRVRLNSQKFLVLFRMSNSCKKRILKTAHGNIELLAEGQQGVVAGSHSSGSRYQWSPGLPDQLPVLTLAQLDQLWGALTASFSTSPIPAVTTSALPSETPSSNTLLTQIDAPTFTELTSALEFLAPHAGDEQIWAEIGMALLSIKDCGKPVRELWLDFSRKAPNWQEGVAENWWRAHATT